MNKYIILSLTVSALVLGSSIVASPARAQSENSAPAVEEVQDGVAADASSQDKHADKKKGAKKAHAKKTGAKKGGHKGKHKKHGAEATEATHN